MADEFDDPADRDLLHAAAGALPTHVSTIAAITYGYSYGYASVSQVSVPAAAVRAAAAQTWRRPVVSCGRSMDLPTWEQAEQISWDAGEPWTFQLVIAPDDAQQRWTLTGQFTRGQERRPIRT